MDRPRPGSSFKAIDNRDRASAKQEKTTVGSRNEGERLFFDSPAPGYSLREGGRILLIEGGGLGCSKEKKKKVQKFKRRPSVGRSSEGRRQYALRDGRRRQRVKSTIRRD